MAGVKGRTGRKKAKQEQVAAGSDQSSVSEGAGMELDSAVLAHPAHIRKAQDKRSWDEAVETLRDAGVLTRVHESLLVHYCEHYVVWQAALREVAKTGLLVTNPTTGNVKQNPAIAIANASHQLIAKMMADFGMKNGGKPAAASGAATNRFALIKRAA